jgi:hypothetical protein
MSMDLFYMLSILHYFYQYTNEFRNFGTEKNQPQIWILKKS